jgi:hypothetical protein
MNNYRLMAAAAAGEEGDLAGHRRIGAGDVQRVLMQGKLLSGACPGEIFTSPTPDKMFECAMQIDGGEGVLLIAHSNILSGVGEVKISPGQAPESIPWPI